VLRPQVNIVFLTLMLTTAAISRAAEPPGAAVSGVVRDAQGVAQMGALVQVVASDSALVGTAFTDLQGRYLIVHLLPGKYQVRASAALFIPALRGNLELRSGAQAIVDLTLNTLFEAATWLPAERRQVDEPSDDWKWTLRSAANRPILRWDEDGDITTGTPESSRAARRVNIAAIDGDGGFGDSGLHNVISLDQVLTDGADVTLRADLGASSSGSSTNVITGYERQLGFAGSARTVIAYQSHPELVGSDGTSGLEAIQLASAEKMQLGDMVDVEAGGAVYVVRTSGFVSASQPFVKVTVHPSTEWTAGYRMATSQNLQSYDGLDGVQRQLPIAVMYQGQMQTERGLHQEFAVGKKMGSAMVQIAYYRDSLDRVAVSGGGALTTADIAQDGQSNSNGVIADSSTGDFRFLSGGYKTQGVNITFTKPLTPDTWVALEYSTGAALGVKGATTVTLPNVSNDLTPEMAQSATIALKGRILRSGTRIRAAYRWQPTRLVTAVDPYAAFSDQAYFSCYLRQAIKIRNFLPPGLDATVDITNLLAQGYRPFLSADGETLFLAQSPRTMQAGLSFTF
jgi:Carboxypeptidase regulatory-like domain